MICIPEKCTRWCDRRGGIEILSRLWTRTESLKRVTSSHHGNSLSDVLIRIQSHFLGTDRPPSSPAPRRDPDQRSLPPDCVFSKIDCDIQILRFNYCESTLILHLPRRVVREREGQFTIQSVKSNVRRPVSREGAGNPRHLL